MLIIITRQDIIEERLTCLEEKLNNIQLSLELLPDMLTRYSVSVSQSHSVPVSKCLSVSVSQCQAGYHGAINCLFLKTATDGTL